MGFFPPGYIPPGYFPPGYLQDAAAIGGVSIPYAPVAPSIQQSLSTVAFRNMTQTHPASSGARWWRSILNPLYNKAAATMTVAASPSPATTAMWLRLEQPVPDNHRILCQSAQKMRRYTDQGVIESGDLLITAMPDEFPFADHDWICPTGRGSLTSNASHFTVANEQRVRGGDPRTAFSLTGTLTVTATSNVVTGQGTRFREELQPGDVLTLRTGQTYIVATITSEVTLTTTTTTTQTITGIAATRGRETLDYWPVYSVDLVLTAAGIVAPASYAVSVDGQTLNWTPAGSPPPGTVYTLRYSYLPRYEIRTALGTQRGGVAGIPLPISIVGKLITPKNERRDTP